MSGRRGNQWSKLGKQQLVVRLRQGQGWGMQMRLVGGQQGSVPEGVLVQHLESDAGTLRLSLDGEQLRRV